MEMSALKVFGLGEIEDSTFFKKKMTMKSQ